MNADQGEFLVDAGRNWADQEVPAMFHEANLSGASFLDLDLKGYTFAQVTQSDAVLHSSLADFTKTGQNQTASEFQAFTKRLRACVHGSEYTEQGTVSSRRSIWCGRHGRSHRRRWEFFACRFVFCWRRGVEALDDLRPLFSLYFLQELARGARGHVHS